MLNFLNFFEYTFRYFASNFDISEKEPAVAAWSLVLEGRLPSKNNLLSFYAVAVATH